jgi:hypothetical protein
MAAYQLKVSYHLSITWAASHIVNSDSIKPEFAHWCFQEDAGQKFGCSLAQHLAVAVSTF